MSILRPYALENQIYLGTNEFVENMLCKLGPKQSLKDCPKSKNVHLLDHYKQQFNENQEAMEKEGIF